MTVNYRLNNKFWLGITFIPMGWLDPVYAWLALIIPYIKNPGLFEFTITFICSLIGCCLSFLCFILDDVKIITTYYYLAFFCLFGLHFILTFLGRWLLLNKVKQQLLAGKVFFNTLMVGSQENAISIYKETEKNLHEADIAI